MSRERVAGEEVIGAGAEAEAGVGLEVEVLDATKIEGEDLEAPVVRETREIGEIEGRTTELEMRPGETGERGAGVGVGVGAGVEIGIEVDGETEIRIRRDTETGTGTRIGIEIGIGNETGNGIETEIEIEIMEGETEVVEPYSLLERLLLDNQTLHERDG